MISHGLGAETESSEAVQSVETNIDVDQRLLHSLVASLYSKSLIVEPATVEALLHIADVLQVHSSALGPKFPDQEYLQDDGGDVDAFQVCRCVCVSKECYLTRFKFK